MSKLWIGTKGTRFVDADGRQVASNEVWAPGPDRRAVPSVPVRAATMEELEAAGYRPGPWQAA